MSISAVRLAARVDMSLPEPLARPGPHALAEGEQESVSELEA